VRAIGDLLIADFTPNRRREMPRRSRPWPRAQLLSRDCGRKRGGCGTPGAAQAPAAGGYTEHREAAVDPRHRVAHWRGRAGAGVVRGDVPGTRGAFGIGEAALPFARIAFGPFTVGCRHRGLPIDRIRAPGPGQAGVCRRHRRHCATRTRTPAPSHPRTPALPHDRAFAPTEHSATRLILLRR